MAPENLIIEAHGAVKLITLNRPKALNALNAQLVEELGAELREAEASDAVRVVVITGSDRAFAAGADIKEMASKSFAEVSDIDMFGSLARDFGVLRKPVIAAVAGFALGGGCELAMLCDFIIAADTAKFGQPEINLGVMAGIGGTQRLTQAVGKAKAMEMNLTGRMMDADEAERAGLVSRIVPADKLLDDALSTAQTIAEKSSISTRAIKEAVNQSFEMALQDGLLFERRGFHSLFATEDQKEGMAAFMDKRKPSFKDR